MSWCSRKKPASPRRVDHPQLLLQAGLRGTPVLGAHARAIALGHPGLAHLRQAPQGIGVLGARIAVAEIVREVEVSCSASSRVSAHRLGVIGKAAAIAEGLAITWLWLPPAQRLAGLQRAVVAHGDERVLQLGARAVVCVDVAGGHAGELQARGERCQCAVAGAVVAGERALQLDAQGLGSEGLAQPAHGRLVVDAVAGAAGQADEALGALQHRLQRDGGGWLAGVARVRVGEREQPAEVAPATGVAHEQRQVAPVGQAQLGAVDGRAARASRPSGRTPSSPRRSRDRSARRSHSRAPARGRRAPRAATRRRGRSRRSGSAARCTRGRSAIPLREPLAALQVVEDDEVATVAADDLPVAAAQRPSVHQRSSTSQDSRTALMARPSTARGCRPLPGAPAPDGATAGPGAARSSLLALERGEHHPALGDARVGVDAQRAQRAVGAGHRAHLAHRLVQARGGAARGPRRGALAGHCPGARSGRRRAAAGRPARAAAPGARSRSGACARDRRSPRGRRPARARCRRPASRAARMTARSVRPRRAGCASRRSMSTPSARSQHLPGGRLGQRQRLLQAFLWRPRPQREVVSVGKAVRERPRPAEAVGDGRAGERGELAHRVHAEPLQRLRRASRCRRGARAGRRRAAPGSGVRPRHRCRGRARGGGPARAAPPPARTGASVRRRDAPGARPRAAPRPGRPPRRRTGHAGRARRSRPAPAGRAPGRAPMPSRERTIASQVSATASGLGGTRSRSGQRARPSPRAIPARTP